MSKKELEFLEFPLSISSLDPVMFSYFDSLLNRRTIIFNDEVNSSIVESVYIPLMKFEQDDSTEEVVLILNTPGGDVYNSFFLCNVIDNYKKKLRIIIPGIAMSMGAILLCAGKNNPNVTKCCYKHSMALFHTGSVAVEGESSSVEDIMEFNRSINNTIKEYIISNTNIDEETYKEHNRKQWYLTADEMLSYGLVDEIIGE